MNSTLATTGTAQLLEQLSLFVPDDFINELLLPKRRLGRRSLYSPAQLYRVHRLALLTSAHSFNLLVRLLKENRSWRRFARLSHRERVPDAKMLHQFRQAAGVAGLRRINEHLLEMFFNSLRLTWIMGLLADAVSLLRAQAIMNQPQTPIPLHELMPTQLTLQMPSADQHNF